MVQVEILAVGNELCYGRVYDTNSFWLADQMTRLGGLVQRITCIRDETQEMLVVLRDMLKRSPRFIFITGGLGPTDDDITIEVLAKLSDRLVVVDQSILKTASEKRGISPSQLSTHHFRMSSTVEGAKCMVNPVGWAPLTILTIDQVTIFAMPGPPKEMQACFKTHIVQEIEKVTQYHSIARRIVVSMFESEVSQLISQIHATIPGVYLKPLISETIPNFGLPVEVIVFSTNVKNCQEKYKKTLNKFVELVRQKGKQVREV
ncbi:MAG: competence/damage-inducible protein A [Candidatus Ranarchaeia archaeon]|jgi:molybdenum cofactor synthesis domain-containing protein